MRNELLLLLSLVVLYGGVLLWMKLFGKQGLYGWTVIATIAAIVYYQVLDRKDTKRYHSEQLSMDGDK